MKVALAIVGIVIVGIAGLIYVFSQTTLDYAEARSRMSDAEIEYLDRKLMTITETTSRERLKKLLGPPYTELSFGVEWKGPSFPGRVRVYFDDDGVKVTRVAFRKIGTFDISFKPWEMKERH